MVKKKTSPLKLPWRCRFYLVLHLLGLAGLSYLGWARLVLALGARDLLSQAGFQPDPLVLGLGGGLWGLLGLAEIGLLFVRRPWARGLVVGLSGVLGLSYWLDRLLFSRGTGALANWPFAALATLVLLAFSASLMLVLRRWD